MLLLGRRPGESIQIGPDIKVSVIIVDGRYVRLGVSAPPELKIYRTDNLSGREPPIPTVWGPIQKGGDV